MWYFKTCIQIKSTGLSHTRTISSDKFLLKHLMIQFNRMTLKENRDTPNLIKTFFFKLPDII